MDKKITFKIELDDKHFDVNKLLSYQDINFFIVKGGRGIGKTTKILGHFIKQFNKNEEEFAYLRRYETELTKSKKVFDRICNDITTTGLGKGAFTYNFGKKRVGYGFCLNKQQAFKSGVDTSKVKYLLFDEAFLLKGGNYHYLKNEVEQLFELISTIFRERKDYKVFIIGNNMDIFDPYTIYFDLPIIEHRYVDTTRGLYVEYAKTNSELLKMEHKSPLYKLTKGTTYNEYHYNNKPLTHNNNIMLGVREPHSYFYTRLIYENHTLTIYIQGKNGNMLFIDYDNKIIKDKTTFILRESNKLNYQHIAELKACKVSKLLNYYYFEKKIYYVNELAYSIMTTIIEEIIN